MAKQTMNDILEKIYVSLHNNNDGIDALITDLKGALVTEGIKVATVDTRRLPVQNRQGRKVMESYFKKRGVALAFSHAGEVALPPPADDKV